MMVRRVRRIRRRMMRRSKNAHARDLWDNIIMQHTRELSVLRMLLFCGMTSCDMLQ